MSYIDTTRTDTTVIQVSGSLGQIATVLSTTSYRSAICADGKSTGKRYFEVKITATGSLGNNFGGLCDAAFLGTLRPGYGSVRSYGVMGSSGRYYRNGALVGYPTGNPNTWSGAFYNANETVAIAVDLDTGRIWAGMTNAGESAINWGAVGASNSNPATETSPLATDTAMIGVAMYPCAHVYYLNSVYEFHLAADEMAFPIPAGFQAWLAEPAAVLGVLQQPLGLYDEHRAAAVDQAWAITSALAQLAHVQPWGLRMGMDLVQPWADAPVRRAELIQPWDSAGVLVAPLAQRWQDLAAIRAELDQPWQIFAPVAGALAQPWAILGDVAQGLLAQGWDLRDLTTLTHTLAQPWAIGADTSLLRYTVEVLADGQPVRVSHVNIEGDLDQDVLSCEIHPETEAEYLRCALGAELQVSVTSAEASTVFQFVITAPRIDEQFGQTRYVVEAMSPAVLLGEPWAVPIAGERSGLASAIATDLAAPLTMDWQTVDWAIPGATLIASQQTPLVLLKQIAAAVGAVVQSQPDGSLRVLPEYPMAVPTWATATPDYSLTETLDLFTTASTPDIRSGHNKFLVGDQMSSADTLRLEEEALTNTTKLVRGYQTPWTGAFSLRHTGGTWVQVEDLGIETRQETETVEIVAGSGRTRYPIVSRDAVTWGQVNLGSVTVAEDGTLSAGVAGESLLTITYTTRCRKWRVRDPNNEQLQLVADL